MLYRSKIRTHYPTCIPSCFDTGIAISAKKPKAGCSSVPAFIVQSFRYTPPEKPLSGIRHAAGGIYFAKKKDLTLV